MDEIHRKYHTVADLFPLMQGDEYDSLKADIAANGLRETICLHPDGSILDGRNRHRACIETETPPRFRTWDGRGSLVGFVVSMNLHRRHLNEAQRAMVAAKIANMPAHRPEISGSIDPLITQPEAAQSLNISVPSLRRAKQVLEHGTPELREAVEQGKIGIAPAAKAATELTEEEQNGFANLASSGITGTTALEIVRGPSQVMAATVFSSESVEYYTPPQYIEAARQVMGDIDLDPASCEAAQKVIGASRYYTKEMDGLKQKWEGRVWLNPPYGKIGNASSQGYWGQRLLEEYRNGNVSEAVLLVKAATGYEWFEKLWDELPACFARERLSFIREDGDDDGSSKQGTAFFYLGENVERFSEVFTQFGRIILPEDQR